MRSAWKQNALSAEPADRASAQGSASKNLHLLFRPSLPKSNSLSYRPSAPDNLHAISPICALLIISRDERRPESTLDSGRLVYGRGGGTPAPPLFTGTAKSRKSGIAQSRNKDCIKISIRSVEPPTTQTKNITSETVQHRITHAFKTFCYTQIQLMQLISIARLIPAIRISGPIARMEI